MIIDSDAYSNINDTAKSYYENPKNLTFKEFMGEECNENRAKIDNY